MRLSVPSSWASVCALLGIGCPAAVRGRIATIIVIPFERVFWRRSLSHVLKKRCERPSPALADNDSATTVVCPAFILRVGTTRDHAAPKHIFWPSLTSSTCAMFQRAAAFCFKFAQKAATAPDLASLHIASVNHGFIPAIASAIPSRMTFPHILSAGKNCKSSEVLTGKIAEGWFCDDARIALAFPPIVVKRTPSATMAPRFAASDTATPSWVSCSHTLSHCNS
jgi:hypothetical protein